MSAGPAGEHRGTSLTIPWESTTGLCCRRKTGHVTLSRRRRVSPRTESDARSNALRWNASLNVPRRSGERMGSQGAGAPPRSRAPPGRFPTGAAEPENERSVVFCWRRSPATLQSRLGWTGDTRGISGRPSSVLRQRSAVRGEVPQHPSPGLGWSDRLSRDQPSAVSGQRSAVGRQRPSLLTLAFRCSGRALEIHLRICALAQA